ncbi:MAG TPA: NADP-dependent oxidoreductase [Solirubrobacteraceae bacterium]|nr:NADP-dependent oxidoreductase [Solirubrobacteraceae bacterium]
MTELRNTQWVLASRPEGMVAPSNFERREQEVGQPGEGQLLVRNLYLSLDPAMRGWMSDAPSYIPPVQIGEVMRGGCVAEVVSSSAAGFAEGELVFGMFGWQDYAVVDVAGPGPVSKLPEGLAPIDALSALGWTSLTAYFGLEDVGKPEPGETVVVSGAAGATGSVVGQLAKLKGCRVIGIAGGPDKCAWLTDDLGFDGAIDYHAEDVSRRLKELCPDGIHVFWDNVGGEILEAALNRLALHGRVVFCGAISGYNDSTPPPGPRNYINVLVRRARVEGFLVFDYVDQMPQALAALAPLVQSGQLRTREDIREGLTSAPEALVDLFTGAHLGKLMVHISDPSGALA